MTTLSGPLFVVAGVLIVAGVVKVISPAATATALRQIGWPSSPTVVRALAAVELVAAIAAIAGGSAVAWAAVAVLYAGFTGFVLWALGGNGALSSCGCFGREDTPPTAGHAAFNAAAAALAGLAVLDPVGLGNLDLGAAETALFAAMVAIGVALAVLALTRLPRLLALVHGTAPAPVRVFGSEGTALPGP